MNVKELAEILKRNHVPDRYYKLPGMLGNDDCHGLDYKDGVWTISYWERGMPNSPKTFATEDEGCVALLQEMNERVTWPISLDAPPLGHATVAFSEYFDRNREIFTSHGWTFGSQGFNTWTGNAQAVQGGAAYLFYFFNQSLKLEFWLSYTELGPGSDGLSAVLCNMSLEPKQRISLREFLLARGFTADTALFHYPQLGLPCEEHLAHFAAVLERAFDGILKPFLEGAPLNASSEMMAFYEYFARRTDIFTSRGWTPGFKGLTTGIGDVQPQKEGKAYLFYYLSLPMKVEFFLSFTDLKSEKDGLSAVLCSLTREPKQRIRIKDFLAASGNAADAALFEYPQAGRPCEEHLALFAAVLERAFDGPLKPALEGIPLSSIQPTQPA